MTTGTTTTPLTADQIEQMLDEGEMELATKKQASSSSGTWGAESVEDLNQCAENIGK